MKKYFFACSLLLICILATIYGCKKTIKEEQVVKPVEASASGTSNSDASIEDITVNSTYGFLEFPDTDDLDEYLEYCVNHTHSQMREYLTNISFGSSLGETLYGDSHYDNETVTQEQAIDYALNSDNIFQISNVLFRPIDEHACAPVKWRYVLTMVVNYLDYTGYNKLKDGTFDGSYMNKLATYSSVSGGLFEFISNTPAGHEDTTYSPCPPDTLDVSGRPRFLGTGWHNGPVSPTADFNETAPGCGCGGWSVTQYYSIFWIDTNHSKPGYECKKGCL